MAYRSTLSVRMINTRTRAQESSKSTRQVRRWISNSKIWTWEALRWGGSSHRRNPQTKKETHSTCSPRRCRYKRETAAQRTNGTSFQSARVVRSSMGLCILRKIRGHLKLNRSRLKVQLISRLILKGSATRKRSTLAFRGKTIGVSEITWIILYLTTSTPAQEEAMGKLVALGCS